MRSIPADLLTHYRGDVTRLAHLWRIKRIDGVTVRATDHDDEIRYEGELYSPINTYTPSALSTRLDMSVDNAEVAGPGVSGAVPAGTITLEDQLSGRYDGAEVRIFRLCYEHPEWGAEFLKRGWLGALSASPSSYQLELRGLTEALQKPIGVILQAACRADLGDRLCGVDLADYTDSGEVSEVTTQQLFKCAGLSTTPDYYKGGRIKFMTGANAGLSFEVKSSSDDGELALHMPPPGAIVIGDEVQVHAGCDKTMPTCLNKFNNLRRYSGEPWVNTDQALNPRIVRKVLFTPEEGPPWSDPGGE